MSEAHTIKAVLSFMNAATWDEATRCIETWPEVLLTEAADKTLAEWLEQSQGNESATCHIKERRALLARYRRKGIGLASTDLLSSFSSPSQISATECLNLTCAQCGNAFSTEVWVLVDASERPDLVERIRASILHDLSCPYCGQTVVAHVPLLLLYFPEGVPLLLLSPALNVTTEQLYTQKSWLVDLLRQQLGNAWRETWREESAYVVIPRPLLSSVLDGNPQRTLRQIATVTPLLYTLVQCIRAPTWEESRQVVAAHPELLSDAADMALEALLVQARAQDDADAQRMLIAHRALLRRCRAELADGAGLTRSPALQAILHHMTEAIRANDFPLGIQLAQHALTMIHREHNASLWAGVHVTLGSILTTTPHSEWAENLEQGLYHYQQALEVLTHQAFPEQWAGIQNALANAYVHRIWGERAKNLEQAIYHSHQALEVHTRQAFPEQWAGVQSVLGMVYAERLCGRRAENLEQALHHHHQTLEVFSRESSPIEWAMAHINLVRTYSDRLQGERTENFQQAVSHAHEALHVFTRDAFPVEWAVIQMNLCIAHNTGRSDYRPSWGERAEELERAIHHGQQALEVFTCHAFPLLALIPPGGALVVPLITARSSAVFVLPHGITRVTDAHVVPLDRFTDEDVRTLLIGPADAPEPGGWMQAYAHFVTHPDEGLGEWFAVIERTGQLLWEAIAGASAHASE